MKKPLSLPILVTVCIASWTPSGLVARAQDQTLGIPYITTSPSTRPNDTWKLSIAFLSSDLDDTKASDDRLQLAADRSSERQASESKERRERAKEKSKIDSATREAWLDEERIDLTSAEFDLLWLLADNAGRVLTREEIFSQLRGIKYDGQDRSIDVRVSRIRPKIGDDPNQPHRIKTVRSKGYLFVKDS